MRRFLYVVMILSFCFLSGLQGVAAREAEAQRRAGVGEIYKRLSKIKKAQGEKAADRAYAALSKADRLPVKYALEHLTLRVEVDRKPDRGRAIDRRDIDKVRDRDRSAAVAASDFQAQGRGCFPWMGVRFSGDVVPGVPAFEYGQEMFFCFENDGGSDRISDHQCRANYQDYFGATFITSETTCQEIGGTNYNAVNYRSYASIQVLAIWYSPNFEQQGQGDGLYYCWLNGEPCEDDDHYAPGH